jgi:hypothetical protein
VRISTRVASVERLGEKGAAEMAQVVGNTNEIAAVYATSNSGDGVYAQSNSGAGVRAISKSDRGVFAHSDGFAVEATSTNLTGVVGITQSSSTDQSGVYGGNGGAGPGVRGETEGGNSSPAVYGSALRSGTIGAGVWGDGGEGYGVVGKSTEGYGVVGVGSYAGIQGTCNRDENPGVYGLHSGSSGDGVLGQGRGTTPVSTGATSTVPPAKA